MVKFVKIDRRVFDLDIEKYIFNKNTKVFRGYTLIGRFILLTKIKIDYYILVDFFTDVIDIENCLFVGNYNVGFEASKDKAKINIHSFHIDFNTYLKPEKTKIDSNLFCENCGYPIIVLDMPLRCSEYNMSDRIYYCSNKVCKYHKGTFDINLIPFIKK